MITYHVFYIAKGYAMKSVEFDEFTSEKDAVQRVKEELKYCENGFVYVIVGFDEGDRPVSTKTFHAVNGKPRVLR